MPRKKEGGIKKVVVVKRGRPEKPLEKIPATFEEIVEAVLKPVRKKDREEVKS